MADLHWFPFYAADWLGSASISMMLPEQEGAYIRLLVFAWGDGAQDPSLPADHMALAQMSRLGSRWRKLGPLVLDQFEEIDGRLYNAKLTSVWQEQQLKHAKTVAKASAGGKAKAQKERDRKGSTSTAPGVPQALPGAVPQARRKHRLSSASSMQNLESEGAVETPLQEFLPAPAPDGALAPEGRSAPGANGSHSAQPNSNGHGQPRVSLTSQLERPGVSVSAQTARRAAIDPAVVEQNRIVAAWCSEHPETAAHLRAELAKEFRGDDAIVARARELAFNAQVLQRLESHAGAPEVSHV